MQDKVVIIRLSTELDAALRAQRDRTGCSTSEFIRRTLTAALKTAEQTQIQKAE